MRSRRPEWTFMPANTMSPPKKDTESAISADGRDDFLDDADDEHPDQCAHNGSHARRR